MYEEEKKSDKLNLRDSKFNKFIEFFILEVYYETNIFK